MIELRYYLAENGKSPFEDWFSGLHAAAAAKVSVALARLEQGNLSNAKGVGEGALCKGASPVHLLQKLIGSVLS